MVTAYIKLKVFMLCEEVPNAIKTAIAWSILFADFFLFGLMLAFASDSITTLDIAHVSTGAMMAHHLPIDEHLK